MTIQSSLTADDLTREGLTMVGAGRRDGAIDVAADEDYFLFAAEPNHVYRITVDAAFDALLGVHDALTGEALTADDDSGAGLNPEVTFVAPQTPDAIILQVDAVGNPEPGEADTDGDPALGAYGLIITDLGLRPDPPMRDPAEDLIDDSLATTAILGAGLSVSERIETAGDIDSYRAYLEAGRTYDIALAGAEGLDAFLQVISPQGALIAENDDVEPGDPDARVLFAPEESAFFVLSASASDLETGTGPYALSVTDIGPAALPGDADSVGDGIVDAAPAELYEAQESRIETAGDADTFAFSLVGGDSYRFEAASRDGALAPALSITDAAGAQLAADEGGPGGAVLSLTPAETGEVFVTVTGAGATSTGAYTLTSEITRDRTVTTVEAQEVALLYEVAFDRDGNIDIDGLNFWIGVLARGVPIEGIAEALLGSDEFAELYGDPAETTIESYVTGLYTIGIERPEAEIDADGRAFWEREIAADNGVGRAEALLAFARSEENVAMASFVDTLEPVGDGTFDFVEEI